HDEFVDGKALGGGHQHGHSALVQQHSPDRLADEVVEEAQWLRRRAAKGRHGARTAVIVSASRVWGQELDPVAAGVLESGRLSAVTSVRDIPKGGIHLPEGFENVGNAVL